MTEFSHANVFGWDLKDHRGFESFEDAFATMDPSNYQIGSYWLIDHSIYQLVDYRLCVKFDLVAEAFFSTRQVKNAL